MGQLQVTLGNYWRTVPAGSERAKWHAISCTWPHIDSEGDRWEASREGGREGGSDRGTEGDSLKIEGRSITYRYPIRDNECVLKCIHTTQREKKTLSLWERTLFQSKKKKKPYRAIDRCRLAMASRIMITTAACVVSTAALYIQQYNLNSQPSNDTAGCDRLCFHQLTISPIPLSAQLAS